MLCLFDDFLNQPNENIITGGGNYLGVISCCSDREEEKIPDWQKIPNFPLTSEFLPYFDEENPDSMDFLYEGYKAAISLKEKLCTQRKNFCDDGTPESYEKGEKNPRCDQVAIQITCDKDLKKYLSSIGKKKICNYKRTFRCI